MPLIDRSDLRYDYNWTTKPASVPRTETTTDTGSVSELFRREEGDDVLELINEYAEKNKISDKQKAIEIEKLLRDEFNEENITRKDVHRWLDNRLDSQ